MPARSERPGLWSRPLLVLLISLALLPLLVDAGAAEQTWRGPLGPVQDEGGWWGLHAQSAVDQPIHTSLFSLCVRGGATAVLQRVTPAATYGPVQLDRAGYRIRRADQYPELGPPGPLPASFVPLTDARVDEPCTLPPPRNELALQLRRTGPGHALVEGIVVHYRVGRTHYRHLLHASIALCDDSYDGGIGAFESCRASENPRFAEVDPPRGPVRSRAGGASGSTGTAAVGELWHMSPPAICMTVPGTAVLDRVEPRVAGAIRIDRTGIWTTAPDHGVWYGGLRSQVERAADQPGYTLGPVAGHVLDGCAVIALNVSRSGPGDGSVRGFEVVYHVGARTYRLVVRSGVTLCDPDRGTTRRLYGCEPDPGS